MTMGKLSESLKKIYSNKRREDKSVPYTRLTLDDALKDVTHKYNKKKVMLEAWRKWRQSSEGKKKSKDEDSGMLLVPKEVFARTALPKPVDVEKMLSKKAGNKVDMEYEISKEVLKQWRDIKTIELRRRYRPFGRKHDTKSLAKDPVLLKRHPRRVFSYLQKEKENK